ncbi:MAG TPA: hypothetical protein VN888_10345 [Mycobacterium sp.]|nr:hypothetical protein [Mycobacterium sp.]
MQLVAKLQGSLGASYFQAARTEKCYGQQGTEADGGNHHCDLLSIGSVAVMGESARTPRKDEVTATDTATAASYSTHGAPRERLHLCGLAAAPLRTQRFGRSLVNPNTAAEERLA